MGYRDIVDFDSLLGVTLHSINVDKESHEVTFTAIGGKRWWMGHHQDCCESVTLDEVHGDWSDLIGSPIMLAEVVTQEASPEGYVHEYEPESETWTFYKLATAKGYVTLRWFGESNGYYSEEVDFEVIP